MEDEPGKGLEEGNLTLEMAVLFVGTKIIGRMNARTKGQPRTGSITRAGMVDKAEPGVHNKQME